MQGLKPPSLIAGPGLGAITTVTTVKMLVWSAQVLLCHEMWGAMGAMFQAELSVALGDTFYHDVAFK